VQQSPEGTSKNSFSAAAGCEPASAAFLLLTVTQWVTPRRRAWPLPILARPRLKKELLEAPYNKFTFSQAPEA